MFFIVGMEEVFEALSTIAGGEQLPRGWDQ